MSAKVAVKVIAPADAKPHVPRHVNSNVQVIADRLVKDVASNFVHRIVRQDVKISVLPYAVAPAHFRVKDLVVAVAAAVAAIHAVADAAQIVAERAKELAVMDARPLMLAIFIN